MAEPQHFCLRWNNYQSSITSAFENLRDDEDFVDVTLACDGRSIKAHRVVLSACSPYFRELLKSTSCKHPVIVLQDVSFLDLHALVEFIYHGEVNVHQNSLSSFLKTAEILRVSGLTQQQAAEPNSQLAHIQNLAAQNSTGSGSSSSHRTSLLNHQAFSDRSSLHDESLYPRGGSSTSPTPPPSLPPHFSSLHHQQHLPRRPTVYRRDRNNSSISDDFSAIKRHRSDNGPLCNPSPDPNSVSPQVTPADFSTIKHNNNNTPPLKDEKRNGPNGNIEKELSPTPSQDRSPTEGDVKSEPMELVCSNNNPNDNNSNDSCNIGDNENNTGRDNPTNSGDVKGSLSSGNDDEHENSVQHPVGNFLISPDTKLFPGSFNFMGSLHEPHALNFNALQSPNDISSQGPQNAHVTGTPSSSNSSPSPNSIAASSNSIISNSSNNNNNNNNNNNADTSPVYIKHPQSPSPTGQLQQPLRMPPPQQGINEPQECPYCKRSFSCYYSLKRHFQDKHEQSDTLYVCEFCQRRYRTKNSLTTHKSLQHRGSSGMLKRLLKTTAIKNVLGSHHRDPFPMAHPRSHFIDFTSDLGQQPPPGIQ